MVWLSEKLSRVNLTYLDPPDSVQSVSLLSLYTEGPINKDWVLAELRPMSPQVDSQGNATSPSNLNNDEMREYNMRLNAAMF